MPLFTWLLLPPRNVAHEAPSQGEGIAMPRSRVPSICATALAYLAAGRSVVPITPSLKAPSIVSPWTGRPILLRWEREKSLMVKSFPFLFRLPTFYPPCQRYQLGEIIYPGTCAMTRAGGGAVHPTTLTPYPLHSMGAPVRGTLNGGDQSPRLLRTPWPVRARPRPG
jgi:hypothetical protein